MATKLGDVAVFSPDRINSSSLTVKNYIGTDNIRQNKAGKDDSRYVPENGNLTGYHKSDILIANIRPYLKKIWFATNDGGSSADVSTLRVNSPDYLPEFIYYNLFQDIFFDFAMKGSKGSKMPRIDKSQIMEFPIAEFDIDTQSKISKILVSIDEKIRLNEKINAELEQMLTLIYEYWFIQYEFPDENGRPFGSSGGSKVYSAELQREIPEAWSSLPLNKIARVIMGQSPKGSSYNELQDGYPLLNGPADYENGSLVGRIFTTEPTRLCKKNDLVFCVRATIGNLTFAEKEFCLGRGVAAVRAEEDTMSELLYFALLQEIERFKIQAGGSIIIGITKDDLTESTILIPDQKTLLKFHEIAKPIIDKIRSNKIENLELISLREWLLPMLMTGQAKVE